MPYSMFDCLMTTICTDRTLPETLNDYDGSIGSTPYYDETIQSSTTNTGGGGENGEQYTTMFERVANFVSYDFSYHQLLCSLMLFLI